MTLLSLFLVSSGGSGAESYLFAIIAAFVILTIGRTLSEMFQGGPGRDSKGRFTESRGTNLESIIEILVAIFMLAVLAMVLGVL